MKKKLLLGFICFASGAWAGERFKTPDFIARHKAVHAFINSLRSRNPDITKEDLSVAFVTRFKLAPGSERDVLSLLYDTEAQIYHFGDLENKNLYDRHQYVLGHTVFYLALALEDVPVDA